MLIKQTYPILVCVSETSNNTFDISVNGSLKPFSNPSIFPRVKNLVDHPLALCSLIDAIHKFLGNAHMHASLHCFSLHYSLLSHSTFLMSLFFLSRFLSFLFSYFLPKL